MKRMEHIELFIMGKNLDAAQLYLDRSTEQLHTAQSALYSIKTPEHKPTGTDDRDWISYEKNTLKLSENITLAEDRLKNTKTRDQNVKKMVDNLTAGIDKLNDSHIVSTPEAVNQKLAKQAQAKKNGLKKKMTTNQVTLLCIKF